MRLNTLHNSRKTLSGLIRAYKKGDISDVRFRNLVHGLSVLLTYWNAEKRDDIEREIDELRQEVERIGRQRETPITKAAG